MITIKEIRETFAVDLATATLAWALLQMKTMIAIFYLREIDPNYNNTKRLPREIAMEALNHLLPNCYGVEALELGEFDTLKDDHPYIARHFGRIVGFYLNRGETYTPTIFYDLARHEFILTSWGDWFEENVILGEPTDEEN